ncbi:hypothetical protein J1N35_022030 [Gossypium stocksii]|uniref:Uncharacterized protein n=1 Tax=Gossypium stocksii TaxID=47602 RepID=A0A9D4A322_9ROSI|nr:hypothetical protein J1N35_022030 [Gossypium stocksii]
MALPLCMINFCLKNKTFNKNILDLIYYERIDKINTWIIEDESSVKPALNFEELELRWLKLSKMKMLMVSKYELNLKVNSKDFIFDDEDFVVQEGLDLSSFNGGGGINDQDDNEDN